VGDHAWHQGNCYAAQRVGLMKANAWGLYDVNGNVWEYCGDILVDYARKGDPDSQASAGPMDRVIRGEGWLDGPEGCRLAYRGGSSNNPRDPNQGLRLVMDLPAGLPPPASQPGLL
jgi:formylglycine-generating enzyme required for sulfatase activity